MVLPVHQAKISVKIPMRWFLPLLQACGRDYGRNTVPCPARLSMALTVGWRALIARGLRFLCGHSRLSRKRRQRAKRLALGRRNRALHAERKPLLEPRDDVMLP